MVVPEHPQQGRSRRAQRARPRPAARLWLLAGLAALLLAGCTGNVTTPGEALRILGTALPNAYLAEPYDQAVQAVGGLRPYDFKLAEGSLPPGIELQGGSLRGTPSKIGQYTFTLQVSDANLSSTVQQYTLTVARVPPPTLDFNAPNTEVARPVTLRVQLNNARQLEGLRTQVRWNPAAFALVQDSVRASRPGLALLHKASKGELQVALVPLGTRIDGQANLFEFQLKPVAGAAALDLNAQTEYISAGGHAFDRSSARGQAASAPSSTTSGGSSSSGSDSGGLPGGLGRPVGQGGGSP